MAQIRQETGYTCGVASARSVVKFYYPHRQTTGEKEANKVIGATPRNGSTAGDICKYLRKNNVSCRIVRRNTSRATLCRQVAQGFRPIVLFQKQHRDSQLSWADGHWSVVVACSATHVTIMDPSGRRQRRKIEWTAFEKRWYDLNGKVPAYRLTILTRPAARKDAL